MYVLRSVRNGDATALADDLRPEDLREITTVNPGRTAEELIRMAFARSTDSYIIDDGRVLGALGVCPSPVSGFGIVWMLACPRIAKYRLITLKYARQLLHQWLVDYPRGVGNGVDSRNGLHQRWLNLLGFSTYKTQDVHGVPFYFMAHIPEGFPAKLPGT